MTWPLFCHNYSKLAVDESEYECSALNDYIINLPDVHAFGIFGNNKISLESLSYDESGNGNTWAFPQTGFTAIRFVGEANMPATCQSDLSVLQVYQGHNHPFEIVPAGDVAYTKNGWVTCGGIVRLDETYIGSSNYVPIAMVGKFRQLGFSIALNKATGGLAFTDRDNVFLSDFAGGTDIVPVGEWFFINFAYHTTTGVMEGWFNDITDTDTGTPYPAYPDGNSHVAGTMCALWNTNDVGYEVRCSYLNGWVVDGYMDGALAYAEYLKTIPTP